MSRTLSGLFLVGALNRPRKRKRASKSGKSPDRPRANRENPRKIGKVNQKGQKRYKKGRTSPDREPPPRLEPRKGGFWKGVSAKMHASLGCGALSAKCTAGPNTPKYFFVSLGVTLNSAETPFAKTPFSRFLTPFEPPPRLAALDLWKEGVGASHHLGELLTSLKKFRATWGIVAIPSQYDIYIWRSGATKPLGPRIEKIQNGVEEESKRFYRIVYCSNRKNDLNNHFRA